MALRRLRRVLGDDAEEPDLRVELCGNPLELGSLHSVAALVDEVAGNHYECRLEAVGRRNGEFEVDGSCSTPASLVNIPNCESTSG
jgi:hypothetical protein